MKLIIILLTLLCYVQRARMNPSVNVLVGTTVFSSIENRGHIRQCTSEYIENLKVRDGGIGSFIKNCTRNDPTPPSEGLMEQHSVMIIGSTAFPVDDDLRKCVKLLKNDAPNPGSETKKCQDTPITTPSPGNRSVSGGHYIDRNEGEEADFICDVVGMRKNDTFSWLGPLRGRKGVLPIYIHQRGAEIVPVGTSRFSFSNENRIKWQMKIRQIDRKDAGEYKCVVQTTNSAGSDHFENASFHLSVNYDVSINGILPNRYPHVRDGQENILYFNETDNATLVCLSDGRPEPKTFWRKGDEISVANNYTIYNISKRDEGLYCCESRQTWTSAVKNVTIVVQHRPITSVSESVIRSKRGKNVNVECQFDSDPLPADAVWYRNGKVLKGAILTLRYSSSYFIDSLDPQKHYGNYTCVVTNILGSNDCRFEITGRPQKPTITSPQKASRMHVYTLEWTFEVYDVKTIERFWLYYTRKDFRDNPAFTLKFPLPPKDVQDPKKPMHYVKTLHDLQPNTTYCVDLFAQNKYGQGDSEYFEFRTSDRDIPTERTPIEPAPTPAGQHNGEERRARASLFISIVIAMVITGIHQS